VILTAAMTGLRRSELLGLRWRDVDWSAQRIRVRNTWVRGEHSTDGKSDLSTRRSVPMADRLLAALDAWSTRTIYTGDNHLVFAHPQTGNPLVGSKSQNASKPPATTPASDPSASTTSATPSPPRSPHQARSPSARSRSSSATPTPKTTQIYSRYAPSTHEVEMVSYEIPAVNAAAPIRSRQKARGGR